MSTLTRTNEALSRLVFQSPAPMELKQTHLHQPANSEDIALNMTFDIINKKRLSPVPSKKMRLDPAVLSSSPTKHQDKASLGRKAMDSLRRRRPWIPSSVTQTCSGRILSAACWTPRGLNWEL
uniref:Uncharacterized protein n=1 Tax=Hucho hucho TaxID=62062 RepID=A0A4W5JWG9_9TELE